MLQDRKRILFEQKIFLIGIFLKQFYILPSGNFQIGDFCMMLSFAVYFLIRKKGSIYISKSNRLFVLYVVCISIINFIYFIIYDNSGFMKSSLYYLFNLLVLILFVAYLELEENSKIFLKLLMCVLKLSLITQACFFLLGFGKWYAGSRYEGTFNDPNQYGVYILFSTLLIYIIGIMFKKKTLLWLIVGFALIVLSASTGMLLGIFAFIVTNFIFNFRNLNKKKIYAYFIVCILVAVFYVLLSNQLLKLSSSVTENFLYERVMEKLTKFSGDTGEESLLSDRGWNRIVEYPQYFVYGSGEGYFQRFNTGLEIHSSVLGPLFYYGLIPFLILVSWLRKKFKNLNIGLYCVYFSILTESFFLVNNRQPMFWMLLVLPSCSLLEKDESIEIENKICVNNNISGNNGSNV